MKPVMEVLLGRLSALEEALVKNKLNHYAEVVHGLRDRLAKAKLPLVPSRIIWDKFTQLYSQIEEVVATIRTARNGLLIHTVMEDLKSSVESFYEVLRKAYYVEKLQFSLPLLLAALAISYRVYNMGLETSWYYLFVVTASAALLLLHPLASTISLSIAGLAMLVFSESAFDAMAGVLIASTSLLYTYVFAVIRSRKFEARIREIVEGVQALVKQGLEVKSLDVNKLVESIKGEFRVPDTGVFKFINKEELVRFKVVLMHLMSPRISTNKGSEKSM